MFAPTKTTETQATIIQIVRPACAVVMGTIKRHNGADPMGPGGFM